MDKNTKLFFEKLADINTEEEIKNIEKDKMTEKENNPEENAFENNENGEEEFEENEGELAVDVYQTPTTFVIESTIAGVGPDNIDISISPNSLTVKGKREKENKVKTEDYLHQECYWGKFSRTIILPQEIDPDKAQAVLKNGILKVVLPKINKTKTKKIKVKFE